MTEEDSFLALVHHNSVINYKSREGVKFTDKILTNIFITMRTRLVDLQRGILRRLGVDGRRRLSIIYYWISISIVTQGVKGFSIFCEPAVEIAASPHPVSSPVVERVSKPLVEHALQPDDFDDELAFIVGDSDDDIDPVSMHQGGASSSGTQQYPPHLSYINLEAIFWSWVEGR
ncbi:hypothetical protein PIB30_038932 [Stylosanthes scabra]|uniref:Uncharacterized protein n=1 Tax=Stylosanthes scabra TaxID=79078 RepID=A0ABU6SEG3_9FABA|nr:hypothetical protein [Stylosanthes scabra]